MRTSFITMMTGFIFLLAGCSSPRHPIQVATNLIHRQSIITTTKEKYPPKSPHAVALYHKEKKVLMPYRIIGVAKVSRYNLMGEEREEATLHEMMKKLAASIGGDGLINIDNSNEDAIQANIIAYQKILI